MKESRLTLIWCIFVVIMLCIVFSIAGCAAEKESEPIPVKQHEQIRDIPLEPKEYKPVFEQADFIEDGYSSMTEWFDDMQRKHRDSMGVAKVIIDTYSNVITDEQIAKLNEYEDIMTTTWSKSEYDAASEAFDAVYYECDAAMSAYLAPKYTGGGYTGGGFDIPYNFRQMGVLNDSDYRYTYYSSNVLYHYRTPEWTLGSDGIYRDGDGRVVVASDAYPEGTVVQSELFGECIVLDCGVGRTDTLDVYVGW